MTTALLEANLHEAGGRIAFREGTGDKYKVRIMGWEPGEAYTYGSSADYPVEALKRDVPTAFPEGTRMRANHDGICEAGGDIRRVIARTTDTPWAEADGMYTNIRVSQEWSPYVKEYGDIIGLSISAAGEMQMEAATDDDGDPILDHDGKPVMVVKRNEETGQPILKRLMSAEESPYNSIDFVEAPGADGRIVAAIESARGLLDNMNIREQATFAAGLTEKKGTGAVPPQSERKEYSMDEETREAISKAVAESVATALPAALEALKPAEPTEEVKGEDVAEAAFKAGLSEGAREAVYERVANGMSVSDAIAKESKREADIRSDVEEKLKAEHNSFGFTSTPGNTGKATEALDAELDNLLEV